MDDSLSVSSSQFLSRRSSNSGTTFPRFRFVQLLTRDWLMWKIFNPLPRDSVDAAAAGVVVRHENSSLLPRDLTQAWPFSYVTQHHHQRQQQHWLCRNFLSDFAKRIVQKKKTNKTMNQTMKLASRDGSNSRACQLALPVSRIWIQLAKTMFLCAGSIQRYSKTRGEKKKFLSRSFSLAIELANILSKRYSDTRPSHTSLRSSSSFSIVCKDKTRHPTHSQRFSFMIYNVKQWIEGKSRSSGWRWDGESGGSWLIPPSSTRLLATRHWSDKEAALRFFILSSLPLTRFTCSQYFLSLT